ncbi:hypothetical protein [uncultured Paludibaculum sp.]|uniref:hypothetical protein n=1 Tax=uncultured Paludibaculum sp. TaxID=1765020 RepID=UPI00374DB265
MEVPLEMRVDAAKHVSRFLHPVLSAAQAQVDVDVQVDGQLDLPTSAILANPTLLASLTELAMLMVEQGTLEESPLRPARLPVGMTDNVIDD